MAPSNNTDKNPEDPTHNKQAKKMSDDDNDELGEFSDIKQRKRMERLEQNRISARESRKRKKTMIEELQRTVITLSRENKELNEKNEDLRAELLDISNKHPNIIPINAIMTGSEVFPSQPVSESNTANPMQTLSPEAMMAMWSSMSQQMNTMNPIDGSTNNTPDEPIKDETADV